MKSILFSLSALVPCISGAFQFQEPVQLKAGGKVIQTEFPGYAAPCLHDLNGDGKKDLLVGQFSQGFIHLFPGKGEGKFGKGDFLKIDGKAAAIPGVW